MVTLRRPRPVRHHVDAYPRLDIREARKQVKAGSSAAIWRDQRGRVWGTGNAILEPDHLSLRSHFRGLLSDKPRVGDERFRLSLVHNHAGATDSFTFCSKCGNHARVLILVEGTWACRNCQRLGYRSAMIGSVARQSERLFELEQRIGDGRPKGMHETNFQALRSELADLKLTLGDMRATASTAYADVITCHWLEGVLELSDDQG